MYYRLGLARYVLVTTDHGLILRKAGAQGPRVGDTRAQGGMTQRFNENHRWENVEQAAAPGQMSLFGGLPTVQDQTPMPAAQAPAAPASHAAMVHSAMAAHRGQMDALVAAHKGRIDGMNLSQLYDHAPDVEYDDYHVDSVNGLDAQIKGSVDPAHHQQIDKHFDDAYSKHTNLGYDGHVKELEKHHSERIETVEKQVESTKSKHLDGFQAFVDDTLSEERISTLDEWNAAKDALGQKYKETLKAATSEITNLAGGSDPLDDFIEELHDAYESALDEYSDDPEDWGNDKDELEESGSDLGDRHYDEFIDLANEAMETASLGEMKAVIGQHYSQILEKGKAKILQASGSQKDVASFEENMKDAYEGFLNDIGDDEE